MNRNSKLTIDEIIGGSRSDDYMKDLLREKDPRLALSLEAAEKKKQESIEDWLNEDS